MSDVLLPHLHCIAYVGVLCRFVRLGTASLLSDAGGVFINIDKLDLKKYAGRPNLARVLCDYIIYHEHNPKRALELCAHASQLSNFEVGWCGNGYDKPCVLHAVSRA
jgi:hypothetical protein